MAWLNRIRTINMFVLAFVAIFFVQKYTIGFIPHLKEIIVFQRFYLYEILFAFTSLFLCVLFIKTGPPDKG